MTNPRAAAFLGDHSTIDTGHAGTVLLHAPFDAGLFDQSLYAAHDVPFPDRLARAVDKRRADYLAGRILVQRAFDHFDAPHAPLHNAPDRAPLWPDGWAGSLSHSRSTCACILSTNTNLHIGIDVETRLSSASEAAVRQVALSDTESALIAGHPEAAHLTGLIFCAKETLFKALYPMVQRVFGFDSAQINTLPTGAHIRLHLTRSLHPDLPEGATFDICHLRLNDQILTWLISER